MQKNKTNHYKAHHQTKEKNKTKMIILISAIIIVIAILATILIKNNNKTAKNIKIGNNSSSQEIVDYILNISSYETQIEVEVKSNKNSNKYKMKQTYIDKNNTTQEVIEPSNIQGVKIIKENNNLRIENTQLSLTKIIENYKDITQNNLDLANFIQNYKDNKNSKFKEENNQIIMETTAKTENNYQKFLSSNSGKTFNHVMTKHNSIAVKRMEKIGINENFTVLDEEIKTVHSGSYGRLDPDSIAPTITTRFDTPSGGRFIHPFENRTITPREAARIQSFPDDFEFVGTKSCICKQIGNAVPPKLSYFLGTMIRRILEND